MKEFLLGTYIKKQRKAMGISQETLSMGLCSTSTLCRIENNQQSPSRGLARLLLERLGLPRDQFFALWDRESIAVESLTRDISRLMVHHARAGEDQEKIRRELWEMLDELERITEKDDLPVRQFLMVRRANLGGPDGTYSPEEQLDMLTQAIRLTCPKFDPEDFSHGYYSMDESGLILNIAQTYSELGERKRAIGVYRQLLQYVEERDKQLAGYANHFCQICNGYAIDLTLEGLYPDAIDAAERGRRTCVYYGNYQFLPYFLAIQAECRFFSGDLVESKRLYLQAFHIYEAFEDRHNLEIMRQEIWEHLGIKMPEP